MKQVVKVSIAGVSFTLENDGYALMKQYLEELAEYYKNDEYSQEVMNDIEGRIMELLLEKVGKEKVVSVEDVSAIIEILGHPADFEGERGSVLDDSDSGKSTKKLYRDVNNKVFGGVCSGLSAYFGIGVVLLRLIFIAVALFVPISRLFVWDSSIDYGYSVIGGNSFGFILLLYIILWIIIPPAKTVEQRCAMKGESLGIDDIHKKVKVGVNAMGNDMKEFSKSNAGKFFKGIGYVISLCTGIVFLLIGFAGIICGSLFCIGVDVFEGLTLMSLLDYVELGIDNTLLIKVLALLSYFLPFIGFIYAGLYLCFRFKSPKWRPGLVIFLLWFVSLIVFIFVSLKAMNPYYNRSVEYTSYNLPKNYDTIYVKMEDFYGKKGCREFLSEGRNYYDAKYVNETEEGKVEFIDYPDLRIVRCSNTEDNKPFCSYLECRFNSFSGLTTFDNSQSLDLNEVFELKDSLVTVKYRAYTVADKYKGQRDRLYFYIPNDTVIKMIDSKEKVVKNSRSRRDAEKNGTFGEK